MKKCKVCQTEFEPENAKGVFCSAKCRQKDYRRSVSEKLKAFKNVQEGQNKAILAPETKNEAGVLVNSSSVKEQPEESAWELRLAALQKLRSKNR
jgi:endogenous inhibitor of DNA gyrase (YacG/DUF329 family)